MQWFVSRMSYLLNQRKKNEFSLLKSFGKLLNCPENTIIVFMKILKVCLQDLSSVQNDET